MHEVTVGFCDVVGFTRLGEGVPAADLGAIATRLAALAADAAEPPVRLIKTIGDAVMFVAPEPAPLLDTVLCLMEAAEREGEQFPSLHGGVAHGQALRRWGDYYGGPVNLAARLTERARASALITDKVVRERAGDEAFSWSDAGPEEAQGHLRADPCLPLPPRGRNLKGFSARAHARLTSAADGDRASRHHREAFGGSIQVFQNTGGVNIASNRVNGNLQCKENRPAPTGGGNVVQGNKEDQCARL